MKLSVICCLNGQSTETEKTLAFLQKELPRVKNDLQLIICQPQLQYERPRQVLQNIRNPHLSFAYLEEGWEQTAECYNLATPHVTGDYVTVLHSGDVFDKQTINRLSKLLQSGKCTDVTMLQKILPNGELGAFRQYEQLYENQRIPKVIQVSVEQWCGCFPFQFGGTVIAASLLKTSQFDSTLGLEAEREFFFNLMLNEKQVTYITKGCVYYSWEYEENDDTFFHGLYTTEWYFDSISNFWLPYMEKLNKQYGEVPQFVQYQFIFSLRARFYSNMNNKNKHVIEEGKGEAYLEFLAPALQYIDEKVILNEQKIPECNGFDSVKWVWGIMKYGSDYCFQPYYNEEKEQYFFGSADISMKLIMDMPVNILFMDYVDGKMEIDGTVHPILYAMSDEVYVRCGERKFSLCYNERYAHTKVFGTSIYKRHSFHMSIPVDETKAQHWSCEAKIGDITVQMTISFDSHFSRLCKAFPYSYWCFGKKRSLMATYINKEIVIEPTTGWKRVKREVHLLFNMFCRLDPWVWKYMLFRPLYFALKPFMTKKPIWMYIDKIYKGGDSSEYLYQYASRQPEDIKHYYLIDKKTSDYKRLKEAGFKPLVKGSLKHKLIFVYADMMIISNSTVYAFNGYGLTNSAFIRDLAHFHVCCVQHGMSVQKIAIAQNRLRDNTRLYFCASKYEIENLSRPVYDYVGYDALKLTGVPRYDGLVDRRKKQIMISPTWRMQAAVPVRTNEGEQRDYNPMFKESSYFKVFNALVNDSRLIAAAKEYGYRIKYVLHPIVSSQVDDFDKNDYVDIVPAVGDMSYETMFCESSLMVTDYSGIQYDFAYMRKPLVYIHHKDIPQHYEEGTFHYDTMAFGEICHDNEELIDTLIDYMKNGCEMKEVYKKRADDFFYYTDHNNCQRIYKEMLNYQEEKILPYRD